MAVDDDDDVMIAPESSGGTNEAGEAFARQGEGGGEAKQTRTRELSESTRSLFKKAADAMKSQLADGGADGFEPVIPPEGGEAEPVVEAPAVAAAVGAPAPEPTAEGVAPALDQRVVAEWERLNAARAEHEKAVAELAARQTDLALLDEVPESPAETIRELVKRWSGASTPEALRDEMAELISELSYGVLGINLAPDVRTRIESKKAQRIVKSHTARLTKREQELAKKTEAAAEASQRTAAVQNLNGGIAAKVAEWPHLAAEEDAGDRVFEVMLKEHNRSGTIIPWEQAAKQADQELRAKNTAWASKRAHLFTPTPAATQAPGSSAGNANQGAPSSIKGAHALTNRGAAAPAPAPAADTGEWDNDARRARSKARLREAIATRQPG
jgi:hypothetical protein